METQPNKDEPTETGAESSDNLLRKKVRDLRPEKDPMGAGNKRAAQTGGPDSTGVK